MFCDKTQKKHLFGFDSYCFDCVAFQIFKI